MKLSLKLVMIGLLAGSSLVGASSVEIELPRVDGTLEKVTLPFPYHALTDEERAQSVYLPQHCYAVLKEDSPLLGAVVGVCTPCFFMGFYHTKLNKIVAMHVHYSLNDAGSVIAVLDEEFGRIKGEDLVVKIFTRNIAAFPPDRFEITPEKQKVLLSSIVTALFKRYRGVTVETVNFSSPPILQGSFYGGADQSVFVDKNFKVSSISLFAEKVFVDKTLPLSLENFRPIVEESCRRMRATLQTYLKKYFRDDERREKPIPLKRISRSERGLDKLAA